MAMEVRLGGGLNMKNINLGSTEIQEVRLGPTLVWQNNIAPFITVDLPVPGMEGDANVDITVGVSTAQVVTFDTREMDDDDFISRYTVTGPVGFTDVDVDLSAAMLDNYDNLTFTIPATLFNTFGNVDSNNVFTLTVIDNNGGEAQVTITVTAAIFLAPTVTNKTTTVQSSSSSATGAVSWTQHPTAISAGAVLQYSTDGGVTWVNGSTVTLSAGTVSCGSSGSATALGRSFLAGTPDFFTTPVSAKYTLSVTTKDSYFVRHPGINPVSFGGGSGVRWRGGYSQGYECDGSLEFDDTPNVNMNLITDFASPVGTYIGYNPDITSGTWALDGQTFTWDVTGVTSFTDQNIPGGSYTLEESEVGTWPWGDPTLVTSPTTFSTTLAAASPSTGTVSPGGSFSYDTSITTDGATGSITYGFPGNHGNRQGYSYPYSYSHSTVSGNTITTTINVAADADPLDPTQNSFGYTGAAFFSVEVAGLSGTISGVANGGDGVLTLV